MTANLCFGAVGDTVMDDIACSVPWSPIRRSECCGTTNNPSQANVDGGRPIKWDSQRYRPATIQIRLHRPGKTRVSRNCTASALLSWLRGLAYLALSSFAHTARTSASQSRLPAFDAALVDFSSNTESLSMSRNPKQTSTGNHRRS